MLELAPSIRAGCRPPWAACRGFGVKCNKVAADDFHTSAGEAPYDDDTRAVTGLVRPGECRRWSSADQLGFRWNESRFVGSEDLTMVVALATFFAEVYGVDRMADVRTVASVSIHRSGVAPCTSLAMHVLRQVVPFVLRKKILTTEKQGGPRRRKVSGASREVACEAGAVPDPSSSVAFPTSPWQRSASLSFGTRAMPCAAGRL